MILKRDLLEAINGLNHDLITLSIRVSELEKKVNKKKTIKVKKISSRPQEIRIWTEEASQCPGIDRAPEVLANEFSRLKNDLTKQKKSINAKKQPRGKDGKFAKKK